MAAITQQISTFLGGISTQEDNKKSSGQVSEILNGYPDPTFGLVKRNGSQFLTTLTNQIILILFKVKQFKFRWNAQPTFGK